MKCCEVSNSLDASQLLQVSCCKSVVASPFAYKHLRYIWPCQMFPLYLTCMQKLEFFPISFAQTTLRLSKAS